MRHYINGEEYDIPVGSDGTIDSDDIRRAGSLPHNRALILKHRDGSNTLINPHEKVRVDPRQHFADSTLHKRGV